MDRDYFSDRDWRRPYGAMGLPDPGRVTVATSTGKGTRPYFNSGVVTVPMHLCQPLGRHWGTAHSRLIEALRSTPELVPAHLHMFSEQLSLGFAIAEAGLDWASLPVEMNFPTHLKVDPAARANRDLAILHDHSEIDAHGFLLRPRSPAAAEAADRFNLVRSDALGIPYHGLAPSRSGLRGAASMVCRARGFAQGRRQRLDASLRRLRHRPLRSSR